MNTIYENLPTIFLVLLLIFSFFRMPILSRIYRVQQITVHELFNRLKSNTPLVLVDVRNPNETADGYIRQAVCAPLSQLKGRAQEIIQKGEGREVVVICERGSRSMMGAITFRKAGAPVVYNVTGGMAHWRNQGYPVIQ